MYLNYKKKELKIKHSTICKDWSTCKFWQTSYEVANDPEENSIAHFVATRRSTCSNTQYEHCSIFWRELILYACFTSSRKKIRSIIGKARPSPASQVLIISLDQSLKMQPSNLTEKDLGIKETKLMTDCPNTLFKQREWLYNQFSERLNIN